MRKFAVIGLLILVSPVLRAQVADPALATGRKFAPFALALKPAIQMSPLPPWMPSPAVVHKETATIEIPIPALWEVPSIEFYALTVAFDDTGAGGPAVEWRAPNGVTSTVSTGLGETGVSLGINARTVLLPQELTRDGGILMISYYGKFDGLLNIAVRPAREDLLAVLGAQTDPALVDEALRVFERQAVSGRAEAPITGDVRNGSVVEAELQPGIEELTGEFEYVVPIQGEVEATMLRLEVLGLDLEGRIEVRVNGVSIGQVGFPAFRLDDPALVPDGLGRPTIAGWRDGSLFIPARFWTEGDNSIVVTLKPSAMDAGRPVFLKSTRLHVRFGATDPIARTTAAPTAISEPDMMLPDPLVPDPTDAPLPEVVTGVR
jgi:hypothetical protein